MALRKGLPAKNAATDADDTRYDLAGLIVCNADGTPRGGVLSPVGTNMVTATATMNVSVARFQGAAVRDSGVVLLANDGPTNVLVDAAPAANSRIDVVWAKQNDSSSTVSVPDANDLPVFGVSKGTAGAVPVKPSVPAGALELATVEIPSTATATNSSGVVITQTAQCTATAGGVVSFRNKAELELWTSAPLGQFARVLADGGLFERTASAWVRAATTPWQSYVPTWAGHTMGNSVIAAAWRYVGEDVEVVVRRVIGTSGAQTTSTTFSLPVAAHGDVLASEIIGNDGSVVIGSVLFPLAVVLGSSTTAYACAVNAAATYSKLDRITNSIPASLATGSETYIYKMRYRAA